MYILHLYSPTGLLSFPYCFIKDVFLKLGKRASYHISCGYYSLISSIDFVYGAFSFNFYIDAFTNLLCCDFCFVL